MEETLLTILIESFARAFALPLGQGMTFEAMYWFGQAGAAQAVAYGLGAFSGCAANAVLGRGLELLRRRTPKGLSAEQYDRVGRYFRRYGIWLLLVYWMPLGALPVIVAGFFRVPWPQMLALSALGVALGLFVQFPAVLG